MLKDKHKKDVFVKTIKLDGAMGEGGGQILRTSITLSMLKQVKVEIFNIRAKRRKPGLLRQHLTCVRAAKAICNATVEGDELGSQTVSFTPGKVKGGIYSFAIGTAGSTSLVCQTILLPLALADEASTIRLEGGTHNGMSPSVTYLEQSFLPILAKMGIQTTLKLEQFGFYPAGGGKWEMHIEPCKQLIPLTFSDNGLREPVLANEVSVTAIVSQLPARIGQREINTVVRCLELNEGLGELKTVASPGPGNILIIKYCRHGHCSIFEVVGELGKSAEKVAKRAVGRLRKFLNSSANVEEYLADQLLLPMLLANNGSFTTTQPSLHTLTNIMVIEQFGVKGFTVEQTNNTLWQIAKASDS